MPDRANPNTYSNANPSTTPDTDARADALPVAVVHAAAVPVAAA